jgi:asparagine synthase (glutamine-hydrolysing)
MCGIAGLVDWGSAEILRRMTQVQAHRGPDDSGVWEGRLPDGTWVGLGSRRLAILDLSSAGHMPMTTPQGDVWITYNGEIYNSPELRRQLEAEGVRFRSRSDTEVILELYRARGPAFLERLNGMFAIAVADLRDGGSLFLARDHFGIKPLYYAVDGRRLAFASEAKALLELPDLAREISPEALGQFLRFLWVPDPLTLFAGIRKLPPAHYAVFRGGRLEIRRYWDHTAPAAGQGAPAREPELVEEVRRRFGESVRRQLLSDVPVGAFLSAGMDSASIVAVMARHAPRPLRTYTITYPAKYRMGETNIDDPEVAARAAAFFGTEHTQIVVEPDIVELLPRLVWHMDEPVADPAMIAAYVVCREARATVTVLLSGIGGDEIFGGYRKYTSGLAARYYRKLPGVLRRRVIEPALAAVPVMAGTPFKDYARLARKFARSASLDPREQFIMDGTYLDGEAQARLLVPELHERVAPFDPAVRHREVFQRVGHADWLGQMMYSDTQLFMSALNLNYNDKMSMANSLEVRVPFLDHELTRWVSWNVPSALKIRGVTTKYVLRRAMKGLVPDEILRQRKTSFGAPVGYWLEKDLREMTDDLLSVTRIRDRGWFRPDSVRQMLQEHRDRRRDWALQIWQLLTLELWARCFLDAAGDGGGRREQGARLSSRPG